MADRREGVAPALCSRIVSGCVSLGPGCCPPLVSHNALLCKGEARRRGGAQDGVRLMAISGIPAFVCAAPPEPGAGCSQAKGGGKVREVEARCGGRGEIKWGGRVWNWGGRPGGPEDAVQAAGYRAATPAL